MRDAAVATRCSDEVIDVDQELEVLTWERFGTASRDLAVLVDEDGYEPDVILTIARGGLPVGAALAYSLGVKNLSVVNVEFYTGVGTRLDFPVLLPSPFNLVDLTGAKILIADDVADTGRTLQLIHETVTGTVADLRTAVLYEKPTSLVRCDYVWARTDRWIDFPWSSASQIVRPARPASPAH